MELASVADLRDARSAATAEELEDLETDLLAGFVLARASSGMADGTVRHGVMHLEQIRNWLGRRLWTMQPRDADRFFGDALKGAALTRSWSRQSPTDLSCRKRSCTSTVRPTIFLTLGANVLFRNLSSANDRRALKLRERRLRRGAAVATITALPTPAWALSGSEEGENTGVSAETVELDAITPEQLSALREKRQATSELTTRFRRVSGRNITTVAAPEPLTFKIPAARDMTIHGQRSRTRAGRPR